MTDSPSATGAPRGATVWALRTALPLEEVDLHLARRATRERAHDGDGAPGAAGAPVAPTLSEDGGGTTVWLPAGLNPERVDLGLEGRWEQVPADGWDARWRATVRPVAVGPYVVTPPWHATGAPTEIVIEPAQAFGTGHHETTAGCGAALAAMDLDGRSVLDVGTGSGVLAIVAARRGARPVVGCDTDPVAVTAARENTRANGAAVTVVEGSLDAVAGGTFDVVVANLDTDTVTRLAGALVNRCAGTLVVSGVSNERAGEAVTALRGAGVDPDVRAGREWTVLTATLTTTTGGTRP